LVLLSIRATRHAEAPSVGLVEVTAFPTLSTATHNRVDGHDRPAMTLAPSTLTAVHLLEPPAGFVDVITFADEAATHREAAGHDTAVGPCAPIRSGDHLNGVDAQAEVLPHSASATATTSTGGTHPIGCRLRYTCSATASSRESCEGRRYGRAIAVCEV